jgi:hypothetical protein
MIAEIARVGMAAYLGLHGSIDAPPIRSEALNPSYQLGISAFLDANKDGIWQTATERPLEHLWVQLVQGPQQELIAESVTNSGGNAALAVPWDGRSKLDGQGYNLRFTQNSNECGESPEDITGYTETILRNQQGGQIGKVYTIGFDCELNQWNVRLEPPLEGVTVVARDTGDVLGSLFIDPVVAPAGSGVTNASGEIIIQTISPDVGFSVEGTECTITDPPPAEGVAEGLSKDGQQENVTIYLDCP